MITEIFVAGRRLDVSADISSLLTFAIDDIRDFSSRQTTFSKTVVLPGTINNNTLFGSIFDTGINNSYDPILANIGLNFNPSKSTPCIIFQDNMQTFKGTLRILEIDIDNGRIEYEVALNGDLTTLNVALTNGLLSDLDFSDYNEVYNASNIVASWDRAPGSGIYYPLIDYGTYGLINGNSKHDWDIRTFRPALYTREYISKMFEAAGFRFNAPLFDTERFKRLIIPHNQKALTKRGSILALASRATPYHYDFGGTGPGISFTVDYDSFTGTNFSLISSHNVQYDAADTITTNVTTKIKGDYIASWGAIFTIELFLYDPTLTPTTVLLASQDVGGASSDSFDVEFSFPNLVFHQNSYLFMTVSTLTPGPDEEETFTVNIDEAFIKVSSLAETTINVNPGDDISLNETIPQNIRQVDFLVSIVKLFNLYVYEDQFDDRLIHIKPFTQFYEQGADSVVDWTYKMDRDQPIKIKPMSELNSKIYQFNYKDDSDYYNDLYKKRYNQGYGSYIFDSEFEFATSTNKLDLIFASTPLVGYVNEEKVYSTIYKKSGTTEETTDSVIRILQTKKIDGVASWNIKNDASIVSAQTAYGYAGHYDDPDNPSNDLNFGGLSELFFQLVAGMFDRTQFNVYWSQYMAGITDKDSKLLIAKFHLTPKDIYELRFSQFRVIDGVLFRLNKITDYNASNSDTCEVELLNVINTNYSYPVGSTVEDDYALQWNDIDALEWADDEEILFN